MRVLVTGATGFVGKNLIPKLLEMNHEVYEITIQPEISKSIYGDKIKSYFYQNNHSELVQFIESANPEIVVHLAAYLTSKDDYLEGLKLLNANINFLYEILDSIKNCSLKLFIYTGTFAEYFSNDNVLDPAYLYAATKTAGRFILNYYSQVYEFKSIIVVPYSIYGGQDSQKKIIDILYDSVEKEVDLTLGEQKLDFVHVDDVVNAYLSIIESYDKVQTGETFFVGTGNSITIKELAKTIEAKINKTLNINWGAIPYRKRDVMIANCNLELNNCGIKWIPMHDLLSNINSNRFV